MKTLAYHTLIIDDDDESKGIISAILQQAFPDITEITETGSIAEAAIAINTTEPDIIFLDVELPDGNGFDFLQQYSRLQAQIIIVTAFDQYALKAIKASVLDYVLKPINRDECEEAVRKALAQCREPGRRHYDFAAMLSRFHNHLMIRKVKVPTLHGFLLADIDTIIRCEASDNYTTLFFNNDAPKTVSRTLGEYEAELRDYGFIRIHHKHLINIRQVTEYQKGKNGGGYVVMQDRKMLAVSVRKKESLMHAFHNRNHIL